MKFKKEDLKELLYCRIGEENDDGFTLIEDEMTEHNRWSISHSIVFKYDGKYYSSWYTVGATEYQDERPWEYEPDEIECDEVVPKEKTIMVYVPKE